jgi:ABC-type proline/glycine betaine transport system ATPase subunit
MIAFGYVSKSHGADGASAMENLSLTVGHGEFLVLIGVSGCGKTTTPNMINRLIAPIARTLRRKAGTSPLRRPSSLTAKSAIYLIRFMFSR